VAGKQVFEIRPAVGWDKGSAVERFAAELPADWRTVYLGDDVTDDDAFRAARPDGFGVVVGSREAADAAYRLPTQGEVASFLDWLVDAVLERRPTTSR
jgi:trehalose 6-phosphate phosphatase